MFFMKKGIWKTRKLLGFIMSLIMIFSLMPGSLSYAEGEKTILTDIEELKELKVQSIEQGTLPDELELPTELKASGYLESGSAEETAEMTVKVKKWQVRLKESVDKEEEGEWKDYKETTEPGVYYFRPVLDETYQLAEGVELPMYALEVSAAEAQTEVVTEAQTEAQTEVVTEAQTEAQTEVVTEAQTEAQTEVVTEAQTEVITEAQTEAQTEVVTEAQTEAQTEVITEAQTEAQTEVVTEAQTEAQTEVITEAQTEAQTEVITEAQTEAQTEVITEAQTEAQTEVVTEAQTETDEFLIVDESSQTFMNMGSSDALTPINDGTETETETSALPPANNGLLGTDPLTSGQEPTSESETQQSETGTTDGTAAQSETGSTDTAQTTPAETEPQTTETNPTETEPQTTETNPTEAVSTELTVPLAQSYQVGQSYQLSYSLPEGASVPEGTTATYTVLSGGDCVTVDANGLMTVLKEGAFTIQVSLLNGQYIGSASSTAVCTHVWTEATCTAPQTCSICGATQGEALGHDWADATCTEPQTCTRCGATQGEALGHDWTDATCTEPQTCARCGATQGKALGHDWMEATCTDPETCSRCGETRGEALGHNWTDATCTDPETCARCGETRGEALGHDWTEATCTDPETCSRCKETRGEALGHSFGDWVVTTEPTTSSTGERTRTCTRCGAQEKETVQRLNIVGNASDNTITGISSELVYGIRRNITFEANGAGMSNTSPINGDVRYVPTTWVIGKTENSFGSAPYSVTFQMANAGTFTLRVNFQKQTYNNGWQSSGEYDVKEVTFQVSENGTAGSATTTGSVQTGDNTQIILFVVLLIVAAVVIGVVIVAGRKKKR